MAKPKKQKCAFKPNVGVDKHTRCPAGTALKRNTRAERKAKKCAAGAVKESVSGHKRHVCRSSKK